MSERLLTSRYALMASAAAAALVLQGCVVGAGSSGPETTSPDIVCMPVDEGIVDAIHEHFRTVPDKDTALYMDERRAAMAAEGARIGLHYPDTSELKHMLKSGGMTPDAAVSLVNEYTLATYGFETTAVIDPSSPEQTAFDLMLLLEALDEEFIEIVRLEEVSRYVIGSPEPGAAEVPSSAFVRDGENGLEIVFGPGNTKWARAHEGAHALHRRYVREFCDGGSSRQVDPAFGSKNPAGFAYGSPRDESVTLAPHAITEYYEDVASTLVALNRPLTACPTLQEQDKDVIIAKMAVASVWLDRLYPGYGDLILMSLAWYCGSYSY